MHNFPYLTLPYFIATLGNISEYTILSSSPFCSVIVSLTFLENVVDNASLYAKYITLKIAISTEVTETVTEDEEKTEKNEITNETTNTITNNAGESNNDKVTEVVNETNDTMESNKIEENTNSSIGNVVSEVLKK